MSRPAAISSSAAQVPTPRISVVVPLFNCLPLTQAMLASLQATIPSGLGHEIILVDDGSTDGTREWIATLSDPPFRVLLNERNLGYAAANNRGAALARGGMLLLLNNDVVLLPGWLPPMLKAHRRLGPRAGVVGNVQIDARTGAVDHAGIVINVTGKPVHARVLPCWARRPASGPVPAVTGACLLIERALWNDLGGLDAAFVNGGEDIDLCFRARALGRDTAIAYRSVIRHHVSSSPGRKRRDEENSHLLAKRWGDRFLALAEHGHREWCRSHLASAFRMPRESDFRTILHALAYSWHLRRDPPPGAVAGVAAGQAGEFARWNAMFPDSAPPGHLSADDADDVNKGTGGPAPG